MDGVWQDLLSFLDGQPRQVRSRPALSARLHHLLKEAWLAASMAGEERIRSLHLLLAMADHSSLMRCDALWPVLTLNRPRIAALRPLLDAQSDERPDAGPPLIPDITVQHSDLTGEKKSAASEALLRFTRDITADARDGKIDPVYGRDNEIRQMVDILSCRRKKYLFSDVVRLC